MSISEKTLELNITHELLSFADSLWMMLFRQHGYNSSIRYPRAMRNQIPVALGLSLQEEKNQGWDVRINFPSQSSKFRAVFIQYKKPYFRSYCKKESSFYHGSKANKRPHYLFGINNNTAKDQHIKLRALANNNHLSNSVLYAFPRILNQKELQQWSGNLTNFTSFITTKELDDIASSLGLSLNSGNTHEIRMLSSGELKEIHSEPNLLSIKDETSKGFISDTISWRMYKFLSFYLENLNDNIEVKKQLDIENFKNCYCELDQYFPISVDNLKELDLSNTDLKNIQASYDNFITKYRSVAGEADLEKILFNIESRYYDSFEKIQKYEKLLENSRYLGDISLQFESKYLAKFGSNDKDETLTLALDSKVNLSKVTYSII